jgi:hypothetical protein
MAWRTYLTDRNQYLFPNLDIATKLDQSQSYEPPGFTIICQTKTERLGIKQSIRETSGVVATVLRDISSMEVQQSLLLTLQRSMA